MVWYWRQYPAISRDLPQCLNADIFLLYDNDDSNGHLIVGQLIFLRIFISDGLQLSSAAIIKTLVEFSLTLDFKAV